MKRSLTALALLLVLVAALATWAGHAGLLPAVVPLALRWIALAALLAWTAERRSLAAWILAAIVVGAEIGADAPRFASHLDILSLIFLRLIKTIIAPLLFAALVGGIAGHSGVKKIGRLAVKSLVFFEVLTTLALLVGLAAINLSRAGAGVHLPAEAPPSGGVTVAHASVRDMALHIFPQNIAKSVAEGQVLEVVVFSILFGVALALVSEKKRRPMLSFTESLAEVMFKFTSIVMLFAPLAVCGAMAYTVAQTGPGLLGSLFMLVATLYAALAAFIVLVFLPVAVLARIPVRQFVRAIAEPVSIAFATSSSEAALPSAMEVMERFGVPRAIVAFVMPTGYSFNLVGSALYLSLAAVWVAQASGIHLSVGRQFVMVFILMLTSKGVAGVARAALVILLATAASIGLPAGPVFILLGVDQLMDMARTAVNVVGNCLATAAVARWEGDLAAPPASAVTAPALARAD